MISDKRIQTISIGISATILMALKHMDNIHKRLLFVFNGNKFVSLISIGDIQRAIIKGVSLNKQITEILRDDIRVAREDDSLDLIKAQMLKWRMECLPVVNDKQQLVKVYFWEDVFGNFVKRKQTNINLPVVVMAGGKGTRLKPITNVLPKPLIPIGEKTILENIMDRFVDAGCSNFFMSVNYKAEMIKHYFATLNNESYNIDYFQEDKPLGTAGSLFLIKNKITSTFFVTNCDIIIDQDLDEIYQFHKTQGNMITIVSVLKHYKIPYGTLETGINGQLKSFIEKPEYTFQINSGMYILEAELLNEIPESTFFHITELIEKVKNTGRKVGAFPVSEGSWIDIGEWKTYLKQIT